MVECYICETEMKRLKSSDWGQKGNPDWCKAYICPKCHEIRFVDGYSPGRVVSSPI